MTRNLKIFTVLVVLGTATYLALSDLINHLPQTLQIFFSFVWIFLFFYIVFNFVYRVIYRFTGVTDKLMFRGRKNGWPRPNHHQAAEVNTYWIVWLAGSLLTNIVYTLIFHNLEWQSAVVFSLVVGAIAFLAKLNNKKKIAGHTKEEIFK